LCAGELNPLTPTNTALPLILQTIMIAQMMSTGGEVRQSVMMMELELVSWSLTSLFSTNMAISEKKVRDGKLSVPSEGRLAIY